MLEIRIPVQTMKVIYTQLCMHIFDKNSLKFHKNYSTDDGALPTEWEAVSHPPHHHPPDLALPSMSQNPQQTASVAGGFVSSAVQSIWRALTTGGNRQ